MNNQRINRSGTGVGDLTEGLGVNSPLVLRARIVFKLLAWIFAVFILIQVFLAGLALFWNSDQWASHAGFSRFLIFPPILMLVTSFIARLPVSIRLYSAGLIGMLILIVVSANLSSEMGYLSAIHPVIALMLFWGTMSIARKTDALIKAK
ncbi:DUF6220 domain-containing protein [Paenibacillus allorhizosphaerae]|uniref:DUF2069 domain-containing protein n=1 Tax=Paenibacillus allorhizosphaerae TaxID=2849866 RepID=A0ABN7TM61_9BACL|nr:DUF6220 domain-containing protein [Paenibacillus allorhizosphaerae]CAG7639113.1 hypothetical protein PAECIP111802_02508 [Paenibacillus allorhizosphaerae]